MPSLPRVTVMSPMTQSSNMETDVLPGTMDMGAGLNVFGEYCGPGTLKLPIIDLTDRGQRVEGTDFVTSELLTVRPQGSGMAKRISGSSQREFSTNFSSTLELEGEAGFFRGELHASFDQSTSQKTDTQFEQFNEKIYLWQLLLPPFTALRNVMLPQAKGDFEADMTPEELVKNYGTHYLRSALIGARSSFSCSINTSTFTSKTSVSATVEAAYKGFVSVSAEAKLDYAAEMEQIENNATWMARVIGGDPKLAAKILDGDHQSWRASVEDNMKIIDIAGGMAPISELVGDPTRREAVGRAIMNAQSDHALPELPNLTPVTGYVDDGPRVPRRWCFAIDPAERPAGFAPYETTFYAFKEPQPDTVPIYRKSTMHKGRAIYLLSLDQAAGEGWPAGEVAFHVYPTDGGMRRKIHAYTANNPGADGWYYSPSEKINGWARRDDFGFFVPAV